MKPALFLDRDGVINREVNYLHKIEDFEFIDGVFESCQFFQKQGYELIVVTNQAGIGRGYYTEADFQTLTDWMSQQFASRNVHIAQTYFSPYHPTHGVGHYGCDHPDRKPNPGMLLRAQQDWKIDLAKSIMVGDKESDISAGLNAGVNTTVLVRSGHAVDEATTKASAVINSIADLPTLFQSWR
ncbi:MAG: D-glycero-beta-D-manno-heptose 1,7-bisphosphate 7-phosphatase [Cyanobacteria bacterium P01_D01_bin.36]